MASADTPLLSDRFAQALTYAHQLHQTQARKGSEIPYISHLLAVAALVLEDGGDEDQAIAALLHDAVEDQGGVTTLEAIRRYFGDHVAELVWACSDAATFPKPPWRERKQAYLKHLKQASPEVLRIAIADKLHNSRSLLFDLQRVGSQVWSRFNAPPADILWFHKRFLEISQDQQPGPLVTELSQVLDQIEWRYAKNRRGIEQEKTGQG
ncbi:MAG: HD domain-containing protein [Acaryochloris sp. RU_4_1]|nr:HD domain-containing protein [Acaryochloris sp. SU_5_25]NJM68445.1 HD domain-containing protein [Acaryochloris sp. RU_4_1]NJR55406.1 HD domain-containing protein [Acaryochloris sp. CRU_2_0]